MFKQTIAVVQLFFVCSVLIGMLGYGVSLSPGDKTLKSSTNAGKAAGFIFFVLFLVSQQGHSLSTNIALVSYDIDYLPLILSALACFGLAKILNVWLRTRLAAF